MITEYSDMPKSMINKVKTNLKKKIDLIIKNKNWGRDLKDVTADELYFVELMSELEKVTGVTDLDVINDLTIEFMEDENNKDVEEYIEKRLAGLRGYKTKFVPKRNGLEQLENSVRKMW